MKRSTYDHRKGKCLILYFTSIYSIFCVSTNFFWEKNFNVKNMIWIWYDLFVINECSTIFLIEYEGHDTCVYILCTTKYFFLNLLDTHKQCIIYRIESFILLIYNEQFYNFTPKWTKIIKLYFLIRFRSLANDFHFFSWKSCHLLFFWRGNHLHFKVN